MSTTYETCKAVLAAGLTDVTDSLDVLLLAHRLTAAEYLELLGGAASPAQTTDSTVPAQDADSTGADAPSGGGEDSPTSSGGDTHAGNSSDGNPMPDAP